MLSSSSLGSLVLMVLLIVARRSAAACEQQREFVWIQWGLVPRWAKDPKIGSQLINARAETAADKPAFRDAFRRRR